MKQGLLLINLGSPKSPEPKDVKTYLGEFLMDKNVIDVPYLLRAFIVKGIILNTRPKKSANAYQRIWTPEGSPLIVNSEQLTNKVREKVNIPVALGMRYAQPSIERALSALNEQEVTEVLLIPMYPQYTMSTTLSVIEKAKEVRDRLFPHIQFHIKEAFFDQEEYIEVLSTSIEEFWTDDMHLLLSYHGIPERHIRKTDPTKSHCKIDNKCCETPSEAHKFCYRHQCLRTSQELCKKLGLDDSQWTMSFQSRLGRDPWLQPYTDKTIENMPMEGKTKLVVVTPAFVADCLETLEEMNMENRELFMESGGEEYRYVPCLNNRDDWAQLITDWQTSWSRELQQA